MQRPRFIWAPLALLALVPASLAAQRDSSATAARAEARAAVQQAQSELAAIRDQQLQVQSRIENAIAQNMQQRARQLSMSNEQAALQQLDAMLISAQDNLLEQRDRVATLGESVRRRTGAVLVVLLRADSSGAQSITAVSLTVGNAALKAREYSPTANLALQRGAVDEIYRSAVAPAAYRIRAEVRVNDRAVTQDVDVSAAAAAITYVQLAVRDGRIVATSWTNRAANP